MPDVLELPTQNSERNAATRAVISEAQFSNLRRQFVLRDETSVRAYLSRYPFLFGLLLEAKMQVVRIFGADTRPALQVSIDPNDGAAQLFVVIPTRLNASAAMSLFDRLEEEWWLAAAERADFRMNFSPEFIDAVRLG